MFRLGLLVVAVALSFPLVGCGGASVDAPITKSEYAPTQAQLDEMTKNAIPHVGTTHAKKLHR